MVEIDPHDWERLIVTFLLSLSNKRTRHWFTGAFILTRLQKQEPFPGFQISSLGRAIPAEGEVFSDVEA
jgi:hypothetical protein